jgi:curved DNA-binding protein CbpA
VGHGSNPYEILGVPAGASRHDIVRAYHRAVRGTHPDARPADPGAAASFRELTAAYELLTDPGRRAAFDRSHFQAPPARQQPPPVRQQAPPAREAAPMRRRAWPGPALWAGPVHIDPPGRGPALVIRPAWRVPDGADELLDWYLTRLWSPEQ